MIRKGISCILLTLFLLSIICTLCSCQKSVRLQHCELGIVLPSEFEEYDSGDSFDASYSDGSLIVGMTRVSFVAAMDDGIPTTLTPLKFAEVYRGRVDKEDSEIKELGDVPYFTYTVTTDDGREYIYLPTFYCTPYAYFVIFFITFTENKAWNQKSILELTKSVYIDPEAI